MTARTGTDTPRTDALVLKVRGLPVASVFDGKTPFSDPPVREIIEDVEEVRRMERELTAAVSAYSAQVHLAEQWHQACQTAMRERDEADAARQGAAPQASSSVAPADSEFGSAARPAAAAPPARDPRDRQARQHQIEEMLRAFAPDADEATEILDALMQVLRRRYERDRRFADVEHFAGRLRFHIVRMS